MEDKSESESVRDIKHLLEKLDKFKQEIKHEFDLMNEEDIQKKFTKSDKFTQNQTHPITGKLKSLTSEFVSIVDFSLNSILRKQSKYDNQIKQQFQEELQLHKNQYSKLIKSNISHMEHCENKMMNYLKLFSTKYLKQLNHSEDNLKFLMDVMKDHEAKKKFNFQIKNLLGFRIGDKGKENNINIANKGAVNNSILSSIRKNSIFESDSKSKKLNYNYKESENQGLLGFNPRDYSSGRGLRFSSERYSEQDQLLMNFLSKSGRLRDLGKAFEKFESGASSKILNSGKKDRNSIIGASAEKKPPTPSKRSFVRGSGKKFSRYDIPDFSLDSPKTNINVSSKMIIDENFDSAERDFKHIDLKDVLDARSLPISLKEESQIIEEEDI